MKQTLDPTREQFKTLATMPSDQPIVMINYLKFKADAGNDETGIQRYRRYGKAAQPFLVAHEGKVIWFGKPQSVVIGPKEEPNWDEVLLVKYPSKEHFIKMIKAEGYPSAIRTGALEDSRLICCLEG